MSNDFVICHKNDIIFYYSNIPSGMLNFITSSYRNSYLLNYILAIFMICGAYDT